MAIIFTQTDTPMVCAQAQYCSPSGLNSDRKGVRALDGGAAGAAARQSTIDAGVNLAAIWFEVPVPSALWNAGAWTVRLRITSVVGALVLSRVDICRISGGCANLATIGNGTPGIALGPGVISVAIAGVAQTPGDGDQAVVIFSFNGVTAGTFGWIADQNIDSPFTYLHLMNAAIQGDSEASASAAMVWALSGSLSGEANAFYDEGRTGDQSCVHSLPSRGAAHQVPARCVS